MDLAAGGRGHAHEAFDIPIARTKIEYELGQAGVMLLVADEPLPQLDRPRGGRSRKRATPVPFRVRVNEPVPVRNTYQPRVV
ncbi:hypothetical protein FXF51_59960 [Nonomuraea sp. PA05]|uniref:hypothetical protein n=1 Tax=Nonomuraea sp. PA05 TaxID=2604466 RepID=UPI0011D72AC9|nr:hypothetical protein [Nonomuraea sp. PA05]TYB45826.1 hypothetical protein FXF51_59960 [Nonomuraea sp. PA05]